MAQDSILGLFTDPNQYLLQQNQAQDAAAMRFAQLTPMQQAQYGIYKGAAQLGGGIGSALGAQDPVLQMQTQRQQILRNVDQTDPASIAAASQQLSRIGDQQGALQLAELSRSAALKKAQADKAMRTASSTTVSERNREMIANAEIKLANNQELSPEEEARVRWLIGQENKPKIFRDSETGEITTIEPIDLATSAPNLAKLVGKVAKEGGAGAGVAGTVSTTAATKMPASLKKEVGTVDEQMTTIDSSINKLTALTPKINDLNLGLYQNIERGVSGFLGKPTEDTVEFKKLKRAVLEQSNNLLLLAKGTQTEGDAQRARDQIADEDTWKNKELLTDAFNELKTTLANTKEALKAKRTTLTNPGIPAMPGLTTADVAPKPSPFSGANPQIQPQAEKPVVAQGKPLTQAVIDKANDAIKRGASREAVLKRLKDQGYTVQ